MKYFRGIILMFFVTSCVFAEGVFFGKEYLASDVTVETLKEETGVNKSRLEAANKGGQLAVLNAAGQSLGDQILRNGKTNAAFTTVHSGAEGPGLKVREVKILQPTASVEAANALETFYYMGPASDCVEKLIYAHKSDGVTHYKNALAQKSVHLVGRSNGASSYEDSPDVLLGYSVDVADASGGQVVFVDGLGVKSKAALKRGIYEEGMSDADMNALLEPLVQLLDASKSAPIDITGLTSEGPNGVTESAINASQTEMDNMSKVVRFVHAVQTLSAVQVKSENDEYLNGGTVLSKSLNLESLIAFLSSQNGRLVSDQKRAYQDGQIAEAAKILLSVFQSMLPEDVVSEGIAQKVQDLDGSVAKATLDSHIADIDNKDATSLDVLNVSIEALSVYTEHKQMVQKLQTLAQQIDAIEKGNQVVTLAFVTSLNTEVTALHTSLSDLKESRLSVLLAKLKELKDNLKTLQVSLDQQGYSFKDANKLQPLLALAGPCHTKTSQVSQRQGGVAAGTKYVEDPVRAAGYQMLAKGLAAKAENPAVRGASVQKLLNNTTPVDVPEDLMTALTRPDYVLNMSIENKKPNSVELSSGVSKRPVWASSLLKNACSQEITSPADKPLNLGDGVFSLKTKVVKMQMSEALKYASDYMEQNPGFFVAQLDKLYADYARKAYADYFMSEPGAKEGKRADQLVALGLNTDWRAGLKAGQLSTIDSQIVRSILIAAQLQIAVAYLEDRMATSAQEALKSALLQKNAVDLEPSVRRLVDGYQAAIEQLQMAQALTAQSVITTWSFSGALGDPTEHRKNHLVLPYYAQKGRATLEVYTGLDSTNPQREALELSLNESGQASRVTNDRENAKGFATAEAAIKEQQMKQVGFDVPKANAQNTAVADGGSPLNTAFLQARTAVKQAPANYIAQVGAQMSNPGVSTRTYAYVVNKLNDATKTQIESDVSKVLDGPQSGQLTSQGQTEISEGQLSTLVGFDAKVAKAALAQINAKANTAITRNAEGKLAPIQIDQIKLVVDSNLEAMIVSSHTVDSDGQNILTMNLSYSFLAGLQALSRSVSAEVASEKFSDIVAGESISISVAQAYTGAKLDVVATLSGQNTAGKEDTRILQERRLAIAVEMTSGAIYSESAKALRDVDLELSKAQNKTSGYDWELVIDQLYANYPNVVDTDELFYGIAQKITAKGLEAFHGPSQTHYANFVAKMKDYAVTGGEGLADAIAKSAHTAASA